MNPIETVLPPRTVNDEDIPTEDNLTYHDSRLQPGQQIQTGYSSTSQTITRIREGIDRPLGLPTQTIGQHIITESQPITKKEEKELITHIPAVIDGSANFKNTITQPITSKDEREISRNLPSTGVENVSIVQGSTYPTSTVQGSTYPISTVQGTTIPTSTFQGTAIPSSTIQGTTYTTTSTVQGTTIPAQPYTTTAVPLTTISSIPVNTTSVYQTQTSTQVIPPVEGVVGSTGEVDSHLKDSVNLGRPNESNIVQQSRWEVQQSEVHSMRLENHQSFENWEANLKVFVADRLNVMDDLMAGMEKKLQWLELGVQKTILWFKEREAQELEFSRAIKHDLPQLGDHFQKVEDPNALADLTKGLKESDAFHAQEKRNREILGNFIKKDILDWILYPSEKEYKLQADVLRKTVLPQRPKLDTLANKRARSYNKYFKEFDKLQKLGQNIGKDDLLFKRQLKYCLAAREELRMLRLYDEQGLTVIKEFTRLSTTRLGEIQRAFTIYLQKYTELYKNQATTPEPILELIDRANSPEAVARLFSVRDLLLPANYEFLCGKIGKSELIYPDLDLFLVNFPESIDPAHSSFILKEWDAIRQGGLLKKDRACSVIATTNNNLLIVEKKHEDQETGKVKDPMNLRFTKVENVENSVEGTTLKVVERTPGTLFTHTHRTKLKFETQEQAQQFLQYVNNQTVGDV